MKIKLLFFLLTFFIATTATYASFPVKRTAKTVEKTELSETQIEEVYTPITTVAGKDLTVGILLWFFLGGLAGHRWYYGKPVGWNILFILTAGGLGVWWIIDLINMLSGKF